MNTSSYNSSLLQLYISFYSLQPLQLQLLQLGLVATALKLKQLLLNLQLQLILLVHTFYSSYHTPPEAPTILTAPTTSTALLHYSYSS